MGAAVAVFSRNAKFDPAPLRDSWGARVHNNQHEK